MNGSDIGKTADGLDLPAGHFHRGAEERHRVLAANERLSLNHTAA
jgi:hypothetical protein